MATPPNIRKAAILLATLPREEAARLLAKMGRAQVPRLTEAIAALDTLPAAEQRAILAEFAQSLSESSSPAGDAFSFLQDTDRPALVAILAQEHPQTAAMVLSQLPRRLAVKVLADMPPERQGTLIRRITVLGAVDPQVLRDLEIALRLRLQDSRQPAATPVRKSA